MYIYVIISPKRGKACILGANLKRVYQYNLLNAQIKQIPKASL